LASIGRQTLTAASSQALDIGLVERGNRGCRNMSKQSLDDFRAHLIAEGKSAKTIEGYLGYIRRFLKHVDEPRIDRITEELARSYFATIKNKNSKQLAAMAVSMRRSVSTILKKQDRGPSLPLGLESSTI
jgi:integrase-like protein